MFSRSAWTGGIVCACRRLVCEFGYLVFDSSVSASGSDCLGSSCWKKGTLRGFWTGRFCWIWTVAETRMVPTVMEACTMGGSSLPDMWVYDCLFSQMIVRLPDICINPLLRFKGGLNIPLCSMTTMHSFQSCDKYLSYYYMQCRV